LWNEGSQGYVKKSESGASKNPSIPHIDRERSNWKAKPENHWKKKAQAKTPEMVKRIEIQTPRKLGSDERAKSAQR